MQADPTMFTGLLANMVAFFMLGGGGIPLGIPPAPEDPLLAKVAPNECIVYFSWAARAEVPADSPNSTDKILAEPSVQALIDSVFVAIGGSADLVTETDADAEQEERETRMLVARLAKLAFSRAGAFYMSELGDEPSKLKGAFLLEVGDEADDLRATLLALQAKRNPGVEIPTTDHFGEKFHWLPAEKDMPKIAWGVKGRYLIVGFGEGSIQQVFDTAVTDAPTWLTEAKKQSGLTRRAQVGYVNVRHFMEFAAKQEGRSLEEIAELKMIGIDELSHVTFVAGLNETGFETRTHLHTGGKRKGLLSPLNGKPLAAADLQTIPSDATVAAAMRFNAGDFYNEVVRIAKEQGVEDTESFEKQFADEMGFALRDGLIASLGDVWRTYSSPTEGGVITGWTFVVDVKDAEKLNAINAKLMKMANDYAEKMGDGPGLFGSVTEEFGPKPTIEFEERFDDVRPEPIPEDFPDTIPEDSFPEEDLPKIESFEESEDAVDERLQIQFDDEDFGEPKEAVEEGFDPEPGFGEDEFIEPRFVEPQPMGPMSMIGSAKIKEKTIGGKKYYVAKLSNFLLPVSPAYAITDKHLVIGLYPQTVKEFLLRGDETETLDSSELTAKRLGDDSLAIAQFDSKALFEALYTYVELAMFSGAMVGEEGAAASDNTELVEALVKLPAISSISKHLGPSTTLVKPTEQGVEIVSHQSFPGGGLGAVTPVAVAAVLPAVQAARAAARRAQAQNNLKQIALAMHNYHDVHRAFPDSYSVDKDGKPLLSWRVHILPYIEQENLYEQFHLDEPWDSEHNKKLIAQMPPGYMAPGSVADKGKTNYLAVAGKDYLFAKPTKSEEARRRSFATVTDGTSNTAAFVEVADDRAVIWTKPDDFEPDGMNVWKGLIGLRNGGFLVAFADGHVSFIKKSGKDKALKAMFTRNGGEPFDAWELEYGDEFSDAKTFDAPAVEAPIFEGEGRLIEPKIEGEVPDEIRLDGGESTDRADVTPLIDDIERPKPIPDFEP